MYFRPLQKPKMSLLILVFICVFAPISSMAAPSTLVIDELRISGENTNDEYIVISNYGNDPINLSGFRLVKRASSTTDYKLIDDFGDFTIKPKQKIVVAHSKYTGSRDFTFVTGTSNTIASNNAIFLLSPDKSIVDLVGYGDAVYYEGTPMAAPSTGEVYRRIGGIDTDNNNLDFVLQKEALYIDLNANKIKISELLPNPQSGGEWFELYNPTNKDVSLANLKVCDALGSRHCYRFDSKDVLVANSYKTYEQSKTKITMNNSGDWLEIYDTEDNLISDSGGDYGDADKGVSLALFGSEYLWTATITPGVQNIYTDTLEIEPDKKPTTKSNKSKVKLASANLDGGDDTQSQVEAEGEVKGSVSNGIKTAMDKKIVTNITIGWILIGLAILLVVGYTLWYFRDYAKDIYYKIRKRDDSARF